MYFGKMKNEDFWGFDIEVDRFETYVEISDEEHSSIIQEANEQSKIIVGDKDGKPILADPPPPSEEEQKQQRLNELLSYLEETDWYAIRFADTGEPIPEEIKKMRQDARDEISELKNQLS
jgi:hypothetical protein